MGPCPRAVEIRSFLQGMVGREFTILQIDKAHAQFGARISLRGTFDRKTLELSFHICEATRVNLVIDEDPSTWLSYHKREDKRRFAKEAYDLWRSSTCGFKLVLAKIGTPRPGSMVLYFCITLSTGYTFSVEIISEALCCTSGLVADDDKHATSRSSRSRSPGRK